MEDIGCRIHGHVMALFPLCRSITGYGLRQTLAYIQRFVPIEIHEVESGTPVLDWTVPLEWNVRSAKLETLDGDAIVDFADSNLHLVQYSEPYFGIVSREELEAHLFSLPTHPEAVPYRTSYYARTWGFCLPHRLRGQLRDTLYRVAIDTTLAPGSLTYGELFLPGACTDEVLFSAHCCHPSLANDNLSAIAVAIELARRLAERPRRLSYRFLFAPGTIGAITWLHCNRQTLDRIRHGLVLTCLGDDAPPTYKKSRLNDAPIDRYVTAALRAEGHPDRVLPFEPMGYDERQYCSPGFNLPVGRLTRSPGGTFPEYHTSLDDVTFVKPAALADSLRLLERVVDMIEQDRIWRNLAPFGEPQLGRRGLYPLPTAERPGATFDQSAVMWVLNLSDGAHSLLDIAERSGIAFSEIAAAARLLCEAQLLGDAELL